MPFITSCSLLSAVRKSDYCQQSQPTHLARQIQASHPECLAYERLRRPALCSSPAAGLSVAPILRHPLPQPSSSQTLDTSTSTPAANTLVEGVAIARKCTFANP